MEILKPVIYVALLGAMLAGCAGVRTDVHVSAYPVAAFPASTYELDRPGLPLQDTRRADDERAVHRRLDEQGFTEARVGHARYVVSMSYDTRPASVTLRSAGSGGMDATAKAAVETPSGWCLATRYRHSLTLRFFDRDSGTEAYSVTALAWDCHADAISTWPYLVESAVGKLPYADGSDWRVTFARSRENGTLPGIISTERIERVQTQ